MKLPRLTGWLIAAVVLLVAVGLLYPQQLGVSLYKLSLVSMAGVAGYWLDRALFPYARPDAFITPDDPFHSDLLFASAMLRRAVIVGCAMLAIGLGA